MARYKLKLRCANSACGHVYSRVVDRITAANPPCPKCRRRAKAKPASDYSDGRAPSIGGTNLKNRAIDETARIVMEDYGKTMGVTDLPDRGLRAGDTMAPKLPPAQQALADNMFGGNGKSKGRMPFNAGQLGAAAMRGAFSPQAARSPDPVMAVHGPRMKVPTKIIASSDDGSR